MAIQRRSAGSAADGLVQAWYDYNDATLDIVAAGVNNQSAAAAYVELTLAADGSRKKAATFLAGTDTSFVIPTQVAQRLRFQINAVGKLDGISIAVIWPAP